MAARRPADGHPLTACQIIRAIVMYAGLTPTTATEHEAPAGGGADGSLRRGRRSNRTNSRLNADHPHIRQYALVTQASTRLDDPDPGEARTASVATRTSPLALAAIVLGWVVYPLALLGFWVIPLEATNTAIFISDVLLYAFPVGSVLALGMALWARRTIGRSDVAGGGRSVATAAIVIALANLAFAVAMVVFFEWALAALEDF